MQIDSEFMISLIQIIWIDLVLSGDNAVVIALACRQLPANRQRIGMLLGAGAAVGLRIIFAFMISYLLNVPFLKIVGGVLLLWIGMKLIRGEDDGHDVVGSTSLWGAVRTIAIADAVMSLDNVVAIAAASRGHPELFVFGLLLSIPLIIAGSALIIKLLERFPIFIWAGAALLGFIAGEMIVSDPAILNWMGSAHADWLRAAPVEEAPLGVLPVAPLYYGAAAVGAALVVGVGFLWKRSAAPRTA